MSIYSTLNYIVFPIFFLSLDYLALERIHFNFNTSLFCYYYYMYHYQGKMVSVNIKQTPMYCNNQSSNIPRYVE